MRLKLDPFAPNGVSEASAASVTNISTQQLSETGVTAGTYGDASNVGQFTVDSTGRITSAQNVEITSQDINNLYATMVKLGLGAF